MILKALRVLRYRGLDQVPFTFAPGINVIVGPNEAGKSSLRAAIRAALYDDPATTAAKVRDDQAWGASDLHVLALDFDVDGEPFTLTKDFARRKATLTDGSGRVWDVNSKVQERIGAALGLASGRLFDATAQVVQAELGRTHLKDIENELGQKVSGAGEDVMTAIGRLDKAINDLERGTKTLAKVPGPLRTLEDRKKKLESEANGLRAAAVELERKQADLAVLAPECRQKAEYLAVTRALLEVNREILRLEKDADALRSREKLLDEKVSRIDETLTRLSELDRALEAATASGIVDDDVIRELHFEQERIALKESEAARLQTPAAAAPGGAPKTGTLAGLAAAALIAAGLVLYVAGQHVAGVAAAVAGIVAAAAVLIARARVREGRRISEARRLERQARLETLLSELATDHRGLSGRLAAIGCASLVDAETKAAVYRALVDERRRAADLLAALREGTPDEELIEQRNVVRRDIFMIEERLAAPDYAPRRLDPLQVQTLELEVAGLETDLKTLQDKEHRLVWEIERLSVDAETLAATEEQLQETRENLELARKRVSVYRAALESLNEAKEQAEVEYREIVQTRACDYLGILSDGRYGRLAVEKDSMKVNVWSDEADRWVPPAEPHLSRGTVDLVYLSVRLALVDVLAGGKRPPLLLDDPFVAFDGQRKAAAARLLKDLSRSYQILLFTCTRDFDGVADRMIELTAPEAPGPTPRAQAVEVATPVGPLWDHPQTR